MLRVILSVYFRTRAWVSRARTHATGCRVDGGGVFSDKANAGGAINAFDFRGDKNQKLYLQVHSLSSSIVNNEIELRFGQLFFITKRSEFSAGIERRVDSDDERRRGNVSTVHDRLLCIEFKTLNCKSNTGEHRALDVYPPTKRTHLCALCTKKIPKCVKKLKIFLYFSYLTKIIESINIIKTTSKYKFLKRVELKNIQTHIYIRM